MALAHDVTPRHSESHVITIKFMRRGARRSKNRRSRKGGRKRAYKRVYKRYHKRRRFAKRAQPWRKIGVIRQSTYVKQKWTNYYQNNSDNTSNLFVGATNHAIACPLPRFNMTGPGHPSGGEVHTLGAKWAGYAASGFDYLKRMYNQGIVLSSDIVMDVYQEDFPATPDEYPNSRVVFGITMDDDVISSISTLYNWENLHANTHTAMGFFKYGDPGHPGHLRLKLHYSLGKWYGKNNAKWQGPEHAPSFLTSAITVPVPGATGTTAPTWQQLPAGVPRNNVWVQPWLQWENHLGLIDHDGPRFSVKISVYYKVKYYDQSTTNGLTVTWADTGETGDDDEPEELNEGELVPGDLAAVEKIVSEWTTPKRSIEPNVEEVTVT